MEGNGDVAAVAVEGRNGVEMVVLWMWREVVGDGCGHGKEVRRWRW